MPNQIQLNYDAMDLIDGHPQYFFTTKKYFLVNSIPHKALCLSQGYLRASRVLVAGFVRSWSFQMNLNNPQFQ
jgi:hypothetical protein